MVLEVFFIQQMQEVRGLHKRQNPDQGRRPPPPHGRHAARRYGLRRRVRRRRRDRARRVAHGRSPRLVDHRRDGGINFVWLCLF